MSFRRDQNPTPEERRREEERRESAALRIEARERLDMETVHRTPAEIAQLEREQQASEWMRNSYPEPGSIQDDQMFQSAGSKRRKESIRRAYEELARERNSR
jgi:hypothetical protein